MEEENNKKELVKALINVQREIQNPKTKETNPYYKSKYAPLPDVLNLIRPVLSKNGLAIYQDVKTTDENTVSVETHLLHSSGAEIKTGPLTITVSNVKGRPMTHAIGAAITYARRYQLMALLGIAAENEDIAKEREPTGYIPEAFDTRD